MSVVRMSFFASRALAVLLAAAAFSVLCQPASAADAKKHPEAPAVAVKSAEPSGAELVGKLLKEQDGPSNPDVPLPQRGLSLSDRPASTPLPGPQIFGRREDGGGVLGLKFPIPATRGAN
jgi:hypothetical protein